MTAKKLRAQRRAPATPAERAKIAPTDMVPQPHGGAIRRGNPGNRGGTGRTPTIVRTHALEAVADGVAVMAKRLNGGGKIPFKERRAAFDSLVRVAFASPLNRLDVASRIAAGWDAISPYIPSEQQPAALSAYRAAWTASA